MEKLGGEMLESEAMHDVNLDPAEAKQSAEVFMSMVVPESELTEQQLYTKGRYEYATGIDSVAVAYYLSHWSQRS